MTKFETVRAIHDEVMPERGPLLRIQRQVRDANIEAEEKQPIFERLAHADSLMMAWMYNEVPLQALRDSLSDADIQAHLDLREREIREVADSMRLTIAAGKSLLEQ